MGSHARELDTWVYIEIGETERGCTGFESVCGIVREWRREWVKERETCKRMGEVGGGRALVRKKVEG